jgi:pyruvyltransferase
MASNFHIDAFWCRVPSLPNFGDALTPWMIRRISGQYPRFLRPDDSRHKFFVVGSIIGQVNAASTVWGSGIMSRGDNICPAATLLAVRGPLTRARAVECGADCPEIFGDPALLLPRFYQPLHCKRYGIGVAPHFSDMPRLLAAGPLPESFRLINMQDPIEEVIDQIVACELIASSSLHGLITSHAYGIPAVWISFRPLPSGDESKFRDYFLSIGREPPQPVRLGYTLRNAEALACRASLPAANLDLEPLWRVCPFRPSP